MKRVFFVRHGEPTQTSPEVLTDRGRQQAVDAARTLAQHNLGPDTRWMTSTAPRAEQTMLTLYDTLHFDYYLKSPLLEKAGDSASGIRNLDAFLRDTVSICRVDPETVNELVVVTHLPLMRMVKGDSVEHGEVVEYVPGSWSNPQVSYLNERALEDAILLAKDQAKVDKY